MMDTLGYETVSAHWSLHADEQQNDVQRTLDTVWPEFDTFLQQMVA